MDRPKTKDPEIGAGIDVSPECVESATVVGNKRQLNHADSHKETISDEDASQIPSEGN